jgi:hypothetical protein
MTRRWYGPIPRCQGRRPCRGQNRKRAPRILASPSARLGPLAARQSQGTVSLTLAPSRVRIPPELADSRRWVFGGRLYGEGGIRTPVVQVPQRFSRAQDYVRGAVSSVHGHRSGRREYRFGGVLSVYCRGVCHQDGTKRPQWVLVPVLAVLAWLHSYRGRPLPGKTQDTKKPRPMLGAGLLTAHPEGRPRRPLKSEATAARECMAAQYFVLSRAGSSAACANSAAISALCVLVLRTPCPL